MIEIKYQSTNPSESKILYFDSFWLRDHCRCEECYNIETKQRKYNLIDIPAKVCALQKDYTDDGQTIQIKWSDNHDSKYDIKQLSSIQKEQLQQVERVLWTSDIIVKNQSYLRVTLCDLITKDVEVKRLVTSLIRFGIAIIDQVPANTAMTEMAIRRVFPVMKTFFGEMYTFSDALDHADSAYTKEYIGPHTDNTYFCDAAGLQALHCLQHVNGNGGENFFIDGFACADKLKQTNSKAYDLLQRVQVPAEYIEPGQHHAYSGPIIRTNPDTGEIIQMRLNVYDRATFTSLPQSQMAEFYDSFRDLLRIVQEDRNCWKLKLLPGMLVIFDNWRIFHARHKYTGSRTMTGCYVARTDYLSKARVLGIID